jgi:hypothetical protein
LQDPDGAILFLDTAAGTVEKVAPSREVWEQQLRDAATVER